MFLGGLAGMAAMSAITPVYDARALLVIEPDAGGPAGATVATASQTPDSASVDSQVQILASRSLAREVISARASHGDAELTGTGRPAPVCSTGAAAGSRARRPLGRRSTSSAGSSSG